MSRPKPDCLTPPNGVLACNMPQQFTVTWPLSNASDTRCARLTSLVKSAALSPYSVAFAFSITSASVWNFAMD